ncbi:GyrI-like domain-containing protein [Legionella erythra]|uniref:Transcription activator n=1 Tax=Legionella erythra TaxID=448 RepID=A0A0W0TRT9_LEGER|nr:GyrI-like domain-containing protein [Legionella erythra]KTC98370.1 transcription activator [Legionella erythra]
MTPVTPTLQTIDAFQIIGLSVRTDNASEFNSSTAKLPTLWQQLHQQPWVKATHDGIYGVYSDYESDVNGAYTVTAGLALSDNPSPDPSLGVITVPGGPYLVFTSQGTMPEAIINAWQSVWAYFSSNTEYRRTYRVDFEHYLGPLTCAVYIGVHADQTP